MLSQNHPPKTHVPIHQDETWCAQFWKSKGHSLEINNIWQRVFKHCYDGEKVQRHHKALNLEKYVYIYHGFLIFTYRYIFPTLNFTNIKSFLSKKSANKIGFSPVFSRKHHVLTCIFKNMILKRKHFINLSS